MVDRQGELADRVAIVAGGGALGDGIGNGRASAILLARDGAKVLVVDLDRALAERTVQMIAEEGGEAVAHGADLTRDEDCKAMVETALDLWGRVDILDNNIGVGSRGSVVTEAPEVWSNIVKINVETMVSASRHAIPAMIAGGKGGAIVNISSISALRPRGLSAYTMSKGAVIALTKAMAVDHAADGIRVNCIAPGPVYTPMVYAGGMSDVARENRRKASPLGIEGSGWDVGEAVRFLASDRARYITGQTLVVDGGVTLIAPSRDAQFV